MITLADIKQAAADVSGLTVAELVGPRKDRPVAWPRQRAMYLAHYVRTDLSSVTIGQHFGERDHTTVWFAVRRVGARLAQETERAEIAAIVKRLGLARNTVVLAALDRQVAELKERLALLEASRSMFWSGPEARAS